MLGGSIDHEKHSHPGLIYIAEDAPGVEPMRLRILEGEIARKARDLIMNAGAYGPDGPEPSSDLSLPSSEWPI